MLYQHLLYLKSVHCYLYACENVENCERPIRGIIYENNQRQICLSNTICFIIITHYPALRIICQFFFIAIPNEHNKF